MLANKKPKTLTLNCSGCGKGVRNVLPSHGGKVLEAWHPACSPYVGKGIGG